MYDLAKAYNRSFFKLRKKLLWRVPIICNAIIKVFNPKSLIDFGCGCGEYIQGFIDKGIDACGIEGSSECTSYIVTPKDKIYIHDLRTLFDFKNPYDLAMCLEVVEHIEESYVDILLYNFYNASKQILLSAASPGQGGNHHVNCQTKEYWEKKFSKFNLYRDLVIENKIKNFLHPYAHKREIRVYYENLLFFKRD